MCKKMICLASFVLALGLVLSSIANAADPSLVGWWKFEEAGGTLYDSSDNHNDGKYTGILYQQPGKEGRGLGFDGTDDTITVGATKRPFDTFSFGGWLKTSVLHELDTEATSGLGGISGQKYAFDPTNGGTVNGGAGLSIGRNGIAVYEHGGNYMPAVATYVAEIGIDWNHVMVVYDNKQPTIYLNGEAVKTGVKSPRAQVIAPVRFGGMGYGYFEGTMDEVKIYSRVLTQKEIQSMLGGYGAALDPSPEDQATGVPPDAVLNWTPGKYADQHDVYFGESFADVNAATNLGPMGPDQVYRGRQDAESYAAGERLNFGQTYYWRIDEINAPPTSHVVFKGDIWSFTVEPYASIIENVTATASSENRVDEGAINTINGSGLDDNDLHSSENTTMWLSNAFDSGPGWIQYEFDRIYKMYQMWAWNYNSTVEAIVGFGIKEATIEYSVDGTNWSVLGTTHEFGRGTGLPGYAHNTTIDLEGVAAKYIKINANSNWGGIVKQYGLSEVRFFYVPVNAREPNPDSGATDVGPDVVLSWRPGREAAEHEVYISTDEQAVIDGTAPVATTSQTQHGPVSLDLGQTYYWKINEVNMAEIPTTWEGDIWNLATPEFLVVDDIEAYGNYEPNRVFDTWKDGWASLTNGSTIGYPDPVFALGEQFAETTIVHGGSQSMPYLYDNNMKYSEAEMTLSPPQDWTKNSIKTLSIWFSGDPNNTPEQMYAKVNGVKVLYEGDATDLLFGGWQIWNIDLTSLSTNLESVNKLAIGFGDEANLKAGGSGLVFFDDIRLYPYSCELITPVEPNQADLILRYEFEGNTNDSTGVNNGTAFGDSAYIAGKAGQALQLDGRDDYVAIQNFHYDNASGIPEVSVCTWIRTSNENNQVIVSFDRSDYWRLGINDETAGPGQIQWCVSTDAGQADLASTARVDNGQWHHVAAVFDNGLLAIYIDGNAEPSISSGTTFGIGTSVRYGYVGVGSESTSFNAEPRTPANFFLGAVDDVRIYDSALSQAEVRWIAGRTAPFNKPF